MLARDMKVLLVPTTEGYGHVSRAKAIIDGLKQSHLDYCVLTDKKRALFLMANGVDPSKIDDSFYGIRYIYTGHGKNLNIPLTMKNLAIDMPKYFSDYRKVIKKTTGPEKFDLVINDVTLPFCRLPTASVITPFHSNAPKSKKDHRRISKHMKSALSEYVVEPVVNLATCIADKFNMDFRPHYIDYEHIYPPVVSEIRRSTTEIKRELGIKTNDKLILDGRNEPPLGLYEDFSREHDDVYFLVRSRSSGSENIRTKEFIAGMIDYINASDLFITDTGFTSVSEGIITKTPMLLADPGTHLEGFKNYSCAIDEYFGKAIENLEEDLVSGINGQVPGNKVNIPGGLPYLMKKIISHAQ